MNSLFAQTFKDVFDPQTTITYLGIDFTNVKVFGHQDGEISDLVDRQFSGINQLVLNEPKKYNLQKAFHRDSVPNNLQFVTVRNKTIVDTAIKSTDLNNVFHLNKSDIDNIVRGYDFGDKKGVGFLFVMESLNKKDERGSMYCTFIDMGTKKVLYTERLTEKPSGFGLRNYWGHTIYEALDDIADKKYKEWARN
jgi:hypothetical protein